MARNLVVCCDGTWNSPTQKDRGRVVPSNVVKLARAVVPPDAKLVYYDPGIGTGGLIDKWTGGALGMGLTRNIKEAYNWIAETYQNGDRLFLFGFSRGAYTVRSLAGLIGLCGLTPAGNRTAADRAYDHYRAASSEKGRAAAAAFKAQQRDVTIHFIGVWDTVGALGVPALSRYGLLRKVIRRAAKGSALAHGFHDMKLGAGVSHAYHAVAIDERRGPFEPSLWEKGEESTEQQVEQAWFAGAQCGVGGGYVDAGLSDHAFMWLAAKALAAGLELDRRYLALRLDPNCHGELRDSMSLVYRPFPAHVRRLGRSTTRAEAIHQSALRRHHEATNAYGPENLLAGIAAGLPTSDGGIDLTESFRL